MIIKRFSTPGLSVNTYLVYDEEKKQGAIIDPTRQIDSYLSFAAQEKIEITDILETHVHADFVSGAKELKAALKDKPTIHCSGMGGKEWTPTYADHIVKDRDSINLGTVRLEAWHTPGHTPEHIIWLAYDEKRNRTLPELAFTGDLLFVGSVGRPDLLGPNIEKHLAKQLFHTLFTVLQPLPEYVEILPSHGMGSLCGKEISQREYSTWGYEKRSNPLLTPKDYEKWHTELMRDMPAPPHFFLRLKKINVTGIKDPQLKPSLNVISIDQLKNYPNCQIVDIRNPESFSSKHLKGSINVHFSHAFPLWAGVAMSEDKDYLLVADDPKEAEAAYQSLKLIGLDRARGIISAKDWKESKSTEALESSPMITPKSLKEKLKDYLVIDVRTPSEWNAGHIEGAKHLEMTRFPEAIKEVPNDRPLAVICRSGSRASMVTSLLHQAGHADTFNVQGGMRAWQ